MWIEIGECSGATAAIFSDKEKGGVVLIGHDFSIKRGGAKKNEWTKKSKIIPQ